MTTSESSVRARVVIVRSGAVALIRRRRGGRTYYLFPGGGVEAGETAEQAARREAREELGVDVELGPRVYEESWGGVRFVYFDASIVGGEFGTGMWPDHAERDEAERRRAGTYEAVWVPLEGLRGLDVRPRTLAQMLGGTPGSRTA